MVTSANFLNPRKGGFFGGSFLSSTSRCIYKLLACAGIKGKESFDNINAMFFIVTSNTLDSNQNITFMI
jgi:hypothetical protein